MQKLNRGQEEAVLATEGPVLVIAGAGTGKTAMLVAKTSYLLEQGLARPEEILLVTFTNKAAAEMKERIIRAQPEGSAITACTFHSFCASLLRRHGSGIGLPPDFQILTPEDESDILSMLKTDILPDDYRDFPTGRKMYGILSAKTNLGISMEEAYAVTMGCGSRKSPSASATAYMEKIEEAYRDYKMAHGYAGYDDLLTLSVKLLEENEAVRRETDLRYRYVFIDEYQDTNALQDHLADLITRDIGNLTVVGDDNQSIYSFRGGNVVNILTFRERHEGCRILKLTENYRSPQEILDVANAIMRHASVGIRKDLTGQYSCGHRPDYLEFDTQQEESAWVLRKIKECRMDGEDMSRTAVMIRSGRQSLQLESLLTQARIPYNKFGGLKFFEKKAVKDTFAFLSACSNESDEISWFRVLSLHPGFGGKKSRQVSQAIADRHPSDENGIPGLSDADRQTVGKIFRLFESIRTMDVREQLKSVLEGYYSPLMKSSILSRKYRANESDRRADDLESLSESVADAKSLYDVSDGYLTARKFIDDFYLESASEKRIEGALTITTIHSAKGLEFDRVIIMDATDGICPSAADGNMPFFYSRDGVFVDRYGDEADYEDAGDMDGSGDDEERRCFYVAVTRARKELYLLHSRTRYEKGVSEYASPSHYLVPKDVSSTLAM